MNTNRPTPKHLLLRPSDSAIEQANVLLRLERRADTLKSPDGIARALNALALAVGLASTEAIDKFRRVSKMRVLPGCEYTLAVKLD